MAVCLLLKPPNVQSSIHISVDILLFVQHEAMKLLVLLAEHTLQHITAAVVQAGGVELIHLLGVVAESTLFSLNARLVGVLSSSPHAIDAKLAAPKAMATCCCSAPMLL